jgi:hypothetical protein
MTWDGALTCAGVLSKGLRGSKGRKQAEDGEAEPAGAGMGKGTDGWLLEGQSMQSRQWCTLSHVPLFLLIN